MTAQVFPNGSVVRRKDQPADVGRVHKTVWSEQLQEFQCQVQFGTRLVTLAAEVLELLPEVADPWRDLARGSLARAQDFRMAMTLERLNRPPSAIATSFGTARAQFLPYQFKPLLKLIDNPRWRILIADEVGLGKTIEAGYVLRELRARTRLARVLVVVPARLRTKWKTELARRFDERFDLPSTRELRRFLDGFESGKEAEFNWIMSYEQVRPEDIQKKFDVLRPALDLAIFDEGHRARNPRTLQHRMTRTIAECSEAMLILTATPLQTGPEDLFWLLHLLDPDSFSSFDVFEVQRQGTAPLMDALRVVRSGSGESGDAVAKLEQYLSQPHLEQSRADPFVISVVSRCRQLETLTRSERIDLERDLASLSFTNAVLTRTLKRDTQTLRPKRDPQSIVVSLSAEEQEAFDALTLLPDLTSWGARMAFATAHRQAASCLPAALARVSHRTSSRRGDELDDFEELGWELSSKDGYGEDPVPRTWAEVEHRLIARLQTFRALTRDSKLKKLLEVFDSVWSDDARQHRPPRKAVVFAFFRTTLEYLDAKLERLGIGHRLIHGGIPMEEREIRIEAFRDDPQIRVLLSSEVGSEGLDLQCSSVLINYDLPWNPMVVEQRIGRLDRIGQLASRISIVNLVIKNSVEERILLRLYERIRLFEESIGDLDPILGEMVQEIAIEALAGGLSPDEEARRIEDAAGAIERRREEARHLERVSDALVAADQAYLDEINALVGGRRMAQPSDIAWLLQDFYRQRYPGSEVPAGIADGVARLHLPPEAASDLLAELSNTQEAVQVAALIRQGPFSATVSIETAETLRRLEFIHRRHPLVQFACRQVSKGAIRATNTYALQVACSALPSGLYLLQIVRFEIPEPRRRAELVPIVFSLARGSLVSADEAEGLLVEVLGQCKDVASLPRLEPNAVELARVTLEQQLERLRAVAEEREAALLRARVTRVRATELAAWQHRAAQAQRNLASLIRGQAPAFPIRMAKTRLEKATREIERLRHEALATDRVHLESEELALALVQVTGGGSER